jgi:hypothetical protein
MKNHPTTHTTNKERKEGMESPLDFRKKLNKSRVRKERIEERGDPLG